MLIDVSQSARILFDIFLWFWSGLDLMFKFIDQQFQNVFSAIPVEAIPFLIGIVLLSIIEFVAFLTNRMDTGSRRIAMKIFYGLLGLLLTLVTIWRLGIVSQIERNARFSVTITEFIVFSIYALFVFSIIYSFWKENGEKIRKSILLILWVLFILITWVIAPVFEQYVLTFSTATQTLFVAIFFAIPNALTSYQDWKKEGV